MKIIMNTKGCHCTWQPAASPPDIGNAGNDRSRLEKWVSGRGILAPVACPTLHWRAELGHFLDDLHPPPRFASTSFQILPHGPNAPPTQVCKSVAFAKLCCLGIQHTTIKSSHVLGVCCMLTLAWCRHMNPILRRQREFSTMIQVLWRLLVYLCSACMVWTSWREQLRKEMITLFLQIHPSTQYWLLKTSGSVANCRWWSLELQENMAFIHQLHFFS